MLKKKDEVVEIIKGAEIEGLDSAKAIEEFAKKIQNVLGVVSEKLEVGDKAKFAGLQIEKKLVKGRPIRNPKTGESLGMSKDKVVVKVK